MSSLSRTLPALAIILLAVGNLAAQATTSSPNQVNGPVTKADQSFFDTPFLWIGIIVFALALVLLFLRKGKTATKNRLHKY